MRGQRKLDTRSTRPLAIRCVMCRIDHPGRSPPHRHRRAGDSDVRSGTAIRHRGEEPMMKTAVMLVCLLVLATGAYAKKDRNRVVMDFATMYGVDEAFVGANPIRGLIGDELPWEIVTGVHGRLTNRGHLRIRVRGLVFTHDIEVPPEKQ